MKALDLTGQTYGRLTVIAKSPLEATKEGFAWECLCICGAKRIARGQRLKSGHVKSCGCWWRTKKKSIHGYYGKSEYTAWRNAIARCYNPKSMSYPSHGGRGILMCEEWRKNFQAFIDHVGPKPAPNLTLDRINNDGHYEPGNVRWATAKQQAANRRMSRSRKHF